MVFTDAQLLSLMEQAFRGGVSGPVRTCECGVVYWGGYSWEVGERERLEEDPQAKPLLHSVGTVEFEGKVYVDGCACWHKRALMIAKFLVNHDHAIADFLTAKKKLLTEAAENAPTVKD